MHDSYWEFKDPATTTFVAPVQTESRNSWADTVNVFSRTSALCLETVCITSPTPNIPTAAALKSPRSVSHTAMHLLPCALELRNICNMLLEVLFSVCQVNEKLTPQRPLMLVSHHPFTGFKSCEKGFGLICSSCWHVLDLFSYYKHADSLILTLWREAINHQHVTVSSLTYPRQSCNCIM